MTTSARWRPEQVAAAAVTGARLAAARAVAQPGAWAAFGADDRYVWGSYSATSAEPYRTVVDHLDARFSCSCASRQRPCKHALALLLLWIDAHVPAGALPTGWSTPRAPRATRAPRVPVTSQGTAGPSPAAIDTSTTPQGTPPTQEDPPSATAAMAGPALEPMSESGTEPVVGPTSGARAERVARMRAGLRELLRWLDDVARAGLADAQVAAPSTWSALAARLVDAQVGGLATRVRRIAGLVGDGDAWHERVAEELANLWLLATAGMRLGELPDNLADAVAVALGWQVRAATVREGVPDTDDWFVVGRSDTREDRIIVRRTWLRGRSSGRWAMLMSFAAHPSGIETPARVGDVVHADLFRYPGRLRWRALLADATSQALFDVPWDELSVDAVADGRRALGAMLAAEPWLEHAPLTLEVAVARHGHGWCVTDGDASLPLAADVDVAALVAASDGQVARVTLEWRPDGLVPLGVHHPDRTIDIGPVAR